MSGAATQEWRNRWRSTSTRKPVALIQIDLDGFSIFAATAECRTPDGQHWEPLIVGDGLVTASTDFASPSLLSSTMTFSLADKVATFGGSPMTLAAALAANQFVGKPVQLWLWERSVSDRGLSRFRGVLATYSTQIGQVKFTAKNDKAWNRAWSPRPVGRAEFPHATEASMGAPLPRVVGDVMGAEMRVPPYYDNYGDAFRTRELIVGGRRVGQALLVDVGRSDSSSKRARVLVAGHKIAQVGNYTPNWGTSPFIQNPDGTLSGLDPDVGDLFNTTTEAGFYLPSDAIPAFYPVFPVEVEASANQCDDPRVLLDPNNEFTPARFDYTGVKRTLSLRLPSVINPGRMGTPLKFYVLYRSDPGLLGFGMRVNNTVESNTSASFINFPPSASPFVVEFQNLDVGESESVMPTDRWNLSELQIEFGFFVSGTKAGWIEVFLCGVAVPFSPQADIISNRRIVTPEPKRAHVPRWRKPPWEHPYVPGPAPAEVVTVTQVVGKFFSNLIGPPDDGSGTFTGLAVGPLRRAPDVFHYLLAAVGLVDEADVETGAGEFGSFADARDLLRTWNQRDMVAALSCAEDIELQRALEWVAAAMVSQVGQCEHDGRWRVIPWRINPDADYPMPVSRWDLLDPDRGVEVSSSPQLTALPGVRIPYGWNAADSSYQHEVAVSAIASQAGHLYRNSRDGLLLVVASGNDKLDFHTAADHTATLTAGLLDPWTRAKDVRTKMHAADSAKDFWCSYGPRIESGINNVLKFQTHVVVLTATVTFSTNDYPSFEALCADIQTQMNISDSSAPTWSVTYNRATLAVTFTHGSGTGTFVRGHADDILPVLGIPTGVTSAHNAASEVPVEERRYCIACSGGAIDLQWRSGAHGLDGDRTSCFEVLGFDWTSDDLGRGTRRIWSGISPKLDLESVVDASPSEGRSPVSVDGRAIYDTPTALECRNRLVALLARDRTPLRFSSDVLADLRVGEVFTFSADMDLLTAYPVAGSGGSWAGRKIRTIETAQRFGSSWHTEVAAVDVTD